MADTADPKQGPVPSRQLVLHVMLSLLVSVGVFVVVSWLVLVPQLAQHERRIRDLEAQISQLSEEAEASEASAPDAVPQVAPAVAAQPVAPVPAVAPKK
jgi:hypothetical protein